MSIDELARRPPDSWALDVLMRVVVVERNAMRTALNASPRLAQAERKARVGLISALEAYEAALIRRNLPVSGRVRDELSLQRALDRS
jgi:hypothetical protein